MLGRKSEKFLFLSVTRCYGQQAPLGRIARSGGGKSSLGWIIAGKGYGIIRRDTAVGYKARIVWLGFGNLLVSRDTKKQRFQKFLVFVTLECGRWKLDGRIGSPGEMERRRKVPRGVSSMRDRYLLS